MKVLLTMRLTFLGNDMSLHTGPIARPERAKAPGMRECLDFGCFLWQQVNNKSHFRMKHTKMLKRHAFSYTGSSILFRTICGWCMRVANVSPIDECSVFAPIFTFRQNQIAGTRAAPRRWIGPQKSPDRNLTTRVTKNGVFWWLHGPARKSRVGIKIERTKILPGARGAQVSARSVRIILFWNLVF